MMDENPKQTGDDRRDFLKKCGTFAAVTPPAVTFLLSTSMSSKAIAASGGRPGHGYGDANHDHWGPPGHDELKKDDMRTGKSGPTGKKP